MTLDAGQQLLHYRLIEKIGEGGMGVVWKADIVTLHSVEEADGVHFITMELVEGRNLAQLLPRGGFPLNRLLEIAIPLADDISRAHRAGITGRVEILNLWPFSQREIEGTLEGFIDASFSSRYRRVGIRRGPAVSQRRAALCGS